MGEIRRGRQFRPFKVGALFMVIVGLILIIISLAGPEWVKVTFYSGKIKSLGLWWDCFKVHTSLNLCIDADWINACAAMIVLTLLCDICIIILGIVGLCTLKRLPYFIAGVVCLVCVVFLIICLIIYPVMFTEEVKDNEEYKSETSEIMYDWTYGVAWGSVVFHIAASIFYFVRMKGEHEQVQQMTSVHQYYNPQAAA